MTKSGELKKLLEKKSYFKVGDKVRYTPEFLRMAGYEKAIADMKGVITKIDPKIPFVTVKWDKLAAGFTKNPALIAASNLELQSKTYMD